MLVAFASALHHQGKRVRILDLDSQGTLSEWLNPKNRLETIPADELLIEAETRFLTTSTSVSAG